MAEQKKTFPMLPIAHWWSLRKKFKQSIPGVVTDTYIATVLDMEAGSARVNVLPFLRALGITDLEGRTGERAKSWRDDEQYPQVCHDMRNELYPEELINAVPNPAQERDRAVRWFANHTGTGEGAAKRMAALYTVISEADATKQPEREKTTPSPKSATKLPLKQPEKQTTPRAKSSQESHQGGGAHTADPQDPGLNINIQIHISADASPDQIEQIFAAMSKHIYRRN